MGVSNLAVRFIVELVGVGAIGYGGFTASVPGAARLLLGIGGPLVVTGVWALLIAPSATSPLTQPQRDLVGTGVLLVAAGALALAGQPAIALGYAVVVVVNWMLMVVLGPAALDAIRPAGPR